MDNGLLIISAQPIALQDGELRLTPKASPTGTLEGTMYYDSDDDHVYVATLA